MIDYKDLAQKFVENYSDRIDEKYWATPILEFDAGRTCSPVRKFYEQAKKACRDGIGTEAHSAPEVDEKYTDDVAHREFLEILSRSKDPHLLDWPKHLESTRTKFRNVVDRYSLMDEDALTNDEKEEIHEAKKFVAMCERVQSSPAIQRLIQLSKTMDETGKKELVNTLSSDLVRMQPFSAVAREILSPMNVRVEAGPGPGDYQEVWETIFKVIKNKKEDFSWCSLIHPYWLDEASVPWAIERLVDRIENGVVASTRPLMSVRVAETGDLPGVISTYAHSWQQGELAAVDERRRQYLATYGFPLFSAARWGQLETVDPNRGFPAAFHGFLATALQFYRDSRNTQMIPDAEGAMKTLDHLGRALRESNENLRRVRATELRGQMEYVKQVLGGSKKQSALLGPLQNDWKNALPGRPGVRDSMDPWEFAVDAVSDLYQWRRPSVTEYRSLAENGEVLLVMTRILTDSSVTLGVQTMWALLDILREPIRQYTSSYKVVTGVDLAAPNPFLGAPALAMARQQMQPPAFPPLRRSWAVELPVA